MRWRAGAVVTLLLCLLTACAGIPENGPVVAGNSESGSDPRSDVVQVVPDGPRNGENPKEIVQGFLEAAGGFEKNHSVARAFLASQKETSWNPNQEAVVYAGVALADDAVRQTASGTGRPPNDPSSAGTGENAASQTVLQAGATWASVRVDVPVQASVDENGRYQPAPGGKRKTYAFELQKDSGQWRITSLADGIVISRSDFDLTFRAFPVYFPDPRGAYLVPDLRWFPGTSGTSTALVRALLAGPSPELAPAVTSGAPDRTRAVGAVVVQNDTATVDLSQEVRSATPRQRWLLQAQLTNTLWRLRGISRVQLTVERTPLDISEAGVASPVRVNPPVDGRPIVVRGDGVIARVRNGRMEAVEGVDGLTGYGATRPAVSSDGTTVAVLVGSGVLVQTVDGDAPDAPLLKGTDLTAPSFDPEGWVWSAPASNRGKVLAGPADGSGPAVEVDAPSLDDLTIHSLRLSRDGARALLSVSDGARARVLVAPVRRDRAGKPLALGDPLSLVPDLTSAREATWADETTVTFLGRVGNDAERPYTAQVGGRFTALPELDGITALASGNGPLDVYASAENGKLYVRSGGRWTSVGEGSWPSFPG